MLARVLNDFIAHTGREIGYGAGLAVAEFEDDAVSRFINRTVCAQREVHIFDEALIQRHIDFKRIRGEERAVYGFAHFNATGFSGVFKGEAQGRNRLADLFKHLFFCPTGAYGMRFGVGSVCRIATCVGEIGFRADAAERKLACRRGLFDAIGHFGFNRVEHSGLTAL